MLSLVRLPHFFLVDEMVGLLFLVLPALWSQVCATDVEPLIIGGSVAAADDFPFFVHGKARS